MAWIQHLYSFHCNRTIHIHIFYLRGMGIGIGLFVLWIFSGYWLAAYIHLVCSCFGGCLVYSLWYSCLLHALRCLLCSKWWRYWYRWCGCWVRLYDASLCTSFNRYLCHLFFVVFNGVRLPLLGWCKFNDVGCKEEFYQCFFFLILYACVPLRLLWSWVDTSVVVLLRRLGRWLYILLWLLVLALSLLARRGVHGRN